MNAILTAIAVTLLIASSEILAADDRAIYHYRPEISTLTGIIRTEDHFGPPNYGEAPETDRIETAYILWLDHPISVVPNENVADNEYSTDTDAFDSIARVQLVAPIEIGLSFMVGRRTVVSGVLFEHFTGHHVTKVLMSVHSANVLDQ